MRILIITARVPPTRCGIGDHSFRLAEQFVSLGHEVTLLCGTEQSSTIKFDQIRVRNILPDLSKLGARVLWSEIKLKQPSYILIQWSPRFFLKQGIGIHFLLTLLRARGRGIEVHTLFHELENSLAQRVSAWLLAKISNAFSVTTEAWVKQLRAWFPWKAQDIHLVPVGSNIPVVPFTKSEREAMRAHLWIEPNHTAIGVFSAHLGQGKANELISESLLAVRDNALKARWIFIGMSEDDFTSSFPRARLVPHFCTGHLDPEQISRWFQCLDLFVCPFLDGISTRRASLVAALAHGVPVVSTLGKLSPPEFFPAGPFTLSSPDPGVFADRVVRMAKEPELLQTFRPAVREFFKAHFQWKKIANEILFPKREVFPEVTPNLPKLPRKRAG